MAISESLVTISIPVREGHTGNIENVCENIQGKNNKELKDNNISIEDTLLEGTVNQHIHSGRKGLYSYGMQNFDDKKSDNDNSSD